VLHDIRARNAARNERVEQSEDLTTCIGREEEDSQLRREEEEDEKLVLEVFSKVSVPGGGSVGGRIEYFDENMQAMINAMPAPIQPAKKKTADNSKSLAIKLAKKQ